MKINSINIKYSLEILEPSSHYFNVGIELKQISTNYNYIDLKLPVWRPGRYLVLDFASSVQDFKAVNSDQKILRWMKTDKCTWRVYVESESAITVSYKIYANEFNLRTKGLDENHAFINPTAVFMFADNSRSRPLTLNVKPYNRWHVTTGMECIDDDVYYAPNYDNFTDSPLEIGNQKDFEFYACGKKHIISFYGEAKFDIERMINDFTRIIKANYEFWGNIPYNKYVFIIHCTPQSGGGTEHTNSTVVGVKPNSFETEQGYLSFLRLISHEFFHTWNVKQLKPAGLTPYDYTRENYTSELWIAEGGTSYYDGLILARTGQVPLEEFFKEIAFAVRDERSRPGYRVQSVAESSFDAWVKFWRQMPNAYYSQSDYYAMGSYVCLVLDLLIRNSSKNKHSLDSVFKAMYERFPLDKKGYTNDDFQKTCGEFAGYNLKVFFDDHVFGTKPIEWEKYLLYAGIKLNKQEQKEQNGAGFFLESITGKVMVVSVLPGSYADRAGIIKGDEVIAVDNLRLSLGEIEKKIKTAKSNKMITLTINRANKIMTFTINLAENHAENYSLEKVNDPTELQRAIYEKWLNTKW